VYTDFEKAFDKVNHNLLIGKLKHYGINNPLLSWFNSFLKNRFQTVKYGNVYSDPISVCSGIPQGDHLSPTLFIIFINDISLAIKNSNLLLFADDAKIFKTINSKSDTMLFQADLNCFQNWCYHNDMQLNINKCAIISFSYKKN